MQAQLFPWGRGRELVWLLAGKRESSPCEGDGPVEFAVPWQVRGLVDEGVEQIPAADPEVGLL